ncbi:MAG: hypothetical protein JNL60_17915 [Bacteroidia bacterium]|nr:hypothetical protein [Bacteroidia bacterium]
MLVGGFAVNIHGFGRTTGDLDLWLADTAENRIPFVNALKEYGIEGAEIFHTLPFIAGYTEIILDNGFAIDVMADLQFFKKDKFQQCYEFSTEFEISDDVLVKVIQLNTLIEEKEKSSRPKDKIDAETLKKLYNL